MADQSLDNSEMINVRWANDDPNPKVIQQVIFQKERRVFNAILSSNSLLPHGIFSFL